MAEKITKVQYFEMINDVIADSEVDNKEELMAFVDKQIELINNKAAKAKETAAQKKVEGDALRDAVQSVLTLDLQTIDAITAQVEGEDITKSKVTARLTQLVKAEIATKEQIKTEDGKKVMAYCLVGAEA